MRDAAAVDLEEAHEQIDHRGLARAGRADDGDLLAGLHLRGKILDNDLVGRIGVAEADVVKRRLRRAHSAAASAFPLSSGSSSLSRKSKMRCAEAEAVCKLVMPCAICVSGEVNRRT